MLSAIRFPSIAFTRTLTLSPLLNTFLGFSIRPQLISEMWSRPSAPPKSTNAPKSVTFFTVPSTVWPTSSFAKSSSCIFFFFSMISSLQLPIILCFFGLNSVTINSTSCPLYFSRFFSYTSDTRLAGINTLVWSTTTLNPPVEISVTTAFNTVLFSNASSRTLLPLSACSLRTESWTWPSPSFILTTLASISSPTFTRSHRFAFGMLVNSLRLMTASALYPIFRTISSSFTAITWPDTTAPWLIATSFCSLNNCPNSSDMV